MTEDEAKTRMCCGPQILAAALVIVAGDPTKVELTPDAGRCIGSACMAWRRLDQRGTITSKTKLKPFVTERPQDYENSPNWTVELHDVQGFCGLAGAPQ